MAIAAILLFVSFKSDDFWATSLCFEIYQIGIFTKYFVLNYKFIDQWHCRWESVSQSVFRKHHTYCSKSQCYCIKYPWRKKYRTYRPPTGVCVCTFPHNFTLLSVNLSFSVKFVWKFHNVDNVSFLRLICAKIFLQKYFLTGITFLHKDNVSLGG